MTSLHFSGFGSYQQHTRAVGSSACMCSAAKQGNLLGEDSRSSQCMGAEPNHCVGYICTPGECFVLRCAKAVWRAIQISSNITGPVKTF
jgi:hypothetical protein